MLCIMDHDQLCHVIGIDDTCQLIMIHDKNQWGTGSPKLQIHII